MIGSIAILLYLFQQEINNEVNAKTSGYLETELNKFEFRITDWLGHQYLHIKKPENLRNIQTLIKKNEIKNDAERSDIITHLFDEFEVRNFEKLDNHYIVTLVFYHDYNGKIYSEYSLPMVKVENEKGFWKITKIDWLTK